MVKATVMMPLTPYVHEFSVTSPVDRECFSTMEYNTVGVVSYRNDKVCTIYESCREEICDDLSYFIGDYGSLTKQSAT